jgi:hypothetical protein
LGEKYLAGYPEGKSNITDKRGINLNLLQYIMIDDDTSYTLIELNTLKGEQRKPKIPISKQKPSDFSSEKDRKSLDTPSEKKFKNFNQSPCLAIEIG